jgi:hypothetical protein
LLLCMNKLHFSKKIVKLGHKTVLWILKNSPCKTG